MVTDINNLLFQGEIKETKHAFNMITFKEGVYTVDFGASISSVQAFAMCIAILHCRKSATLSVSHCSGEARTILQGGSPTSYVPDRRPPVGRA